MTRRQFISTALGAGLFHAAAFAMSGCGGEAGQPSRGSLSLPPKDGAESTTSEQNKPTAASKGKPGGRGGS